ncbi:MAG: hypothetical protein JWQ02_400 [Capsulimonas sp.]|jgi:hypothetical protein|nr:hypothetical protein [Capsulimonas sp.]
MFNTGKRAGLALLLTMGMGTLAVQSNAANLRWSGDVDDKATIRISGTDVRVRATSGGVSNEHHDFQGGGLPNRPVSVNLRQTDGRGTVQLVQEPNANNNYTAVVRIHDTDSGKGHYSFDLQWNDRGGRGRNRRGYVPTGHGGWR